LAARSVSFTAISVSYFEWSATIAQNLTFRQVNMSNFNVLSANFAAGQLRFLTKVFMDAKSREKRRDF